MNKPPQLAWQSLSSEALPSAVCLAEAPCGMSRSLLPVSAVSAMSRRNASRTPMEMPPVCRNRYCVGSWKRLLSAVAGNMTLNGGSSLLHGFLSHI